MQQRHHLRVRTLFAVLCSTVLLACAAKPPVPAGPDLVLAANLAKLQERPTITDVDWRLPKAIIGGVSGTSANVVDSVFPAPAALADAAEYSRAHSGKGLMVWYDGALVHSDFAEGMDATTHFSSFSMNKTVLALAMLAAIEDGIIDSLDDPVSKYLRQWRGQERGAITLRQLLTHSSGLEHLPFNAPQVAGITLSSRIGEAALDWNMTGTAGDAFQYSNINSLVAGMALQAQLQRRKRSYSSYVSERLWKPIGNQDAALWLDREGGTSRFHSGLEAGLADWLNVGRLIANRGAVGTTQVLTADSIAELVRPSATNPAYGLHIWLGDAWEPMRSYGPGTAAKVIHTEPYLTKDVWFLDGFGGQRVYALPEHKLVIARFGEVDFSYDDSAVVNIVLRGLMDARAATARAQYSSAENDALYSKRFNELMQAAQLGRGLLGYDPLVALPGANDAPSMPLQPASWIDQETKERLKQIADETNTLAIQVMHEGKLVYADFADDLDATSPVISRSLSKPISVVAVGRAIQRGYIESLDQPIADFLDEWRDTPKAAITLRQLLQMRSGLAPQGGSRSPDDIMNRAYLHPFHTEIIINEYPLTTVPGERYDYSNANAELVAPIIERATGRRYEQWLSEAVLAPLGAPGGQIWANRIGGTTHSGCCALLPSQTWLMLSEMLLNDGVAHGKRLLPEGFVEQMITPTAQYPHAAMGVYVGGRYVERRGHANPDVQFSKVFHSEPYLANDLFLFDGNGNQVSYIVPSHELIILRLGVAPDKPRVWDNAALPNLLLRALQANAGAPLTPQPR